MRDNTLREAARSYARAAMDLLPKLCEERAPDVFPGVRKWVRRDESTFVLRDLEEPYWSKCISAHNSQLSSLKEHEQLIATFRTDPEIAAQVGTAVGTPIHLLGVNAGQMASHLLRSVAGKSGQLRFEDIPFDEVFSQFDADLRRTKFDFVLLAPLWNLKLASTPIQLSPSVEIAQMSDLEIARCLEMGLFPGPLIGGDVRLSACPAVHVHYSVPKQVGGSVTIEQLNNALDAHQDREEVVRTVLHAMRLFKSGRVAVPGNVVFCELWRLAGGTCSTAPDISIAYRKQYELTEHETEEFREFWVDVQRAAKSRFVAAAMRRFGFAGERRRPDDRLIDMMIAAESFFLSGVGAPADRGELTFRMALRFAFFAEFPSYSRRDLFIQMRNAYRVRSAIVHGGTPDENDIRSKDGKVTLQQFVDLIEQILRAAIKVGVKKAAADEPNFGDWEHLILC